MKFILLKPTVQCWRLFQLLLVTAILGLEFAQLKAYRTWYYDEPSHGSASYFWLVVFLTYVILLYFLSSFSYRWITGPYRNEIYIDLFFTNLWITISLMNLVSVFNGGKLTCDYPEDADQQVRKGRCRVFLSSMSLGWVVVATFMGSTYISIMRWRKRPIEAKTPKSIEPPTVSHRPDTYLVQKGVLADGQPVLFFHMAQKNNSSSNLSTKTGGTSGNVTPTTSSHNASTSNLHNFTSNQQTTSPTRTSIYLRDKETNEA